MPKNIYAPLIARALKHLDDPAGSTAEAIADCVNRLFHDEITAGYRRGVLRAIKSGLEKGDLVRSGKRYRLSTSGDAISPPPRELTPEEELIMTGCHGDGMLPDHLSRGFVDEMSDDELEEAKDWLMEQGYLKLGSCPEGFEVYKWTAKARKTYSYVPGDEYSDASIACYLL
ncbi:linker histone H1 [Acanthamoeba castellanii medusavirus]|uniref:Linker histone H1 n=1 Tax=Acanthamoeba castellanii medusavirus J1 TaxID=3114988 RepID=A0A3T1CWP1_9VIRU|nr:linker histone H1 [Acanthamoeba castellanii medusavirus]BBI30246.1 linker histone H1 [Acanthamoeba castellanii medusavirus J1]